MMRDALEQRPGIAAMPFYEYECSNCKFYVEALQKISDPPLVKCPSCGKQTLKRLVSAPNFRLKGSGWYETDFKSDKEAKRNIAGGEEAPASDSKETDESKQPKRAPRKAAVGKARAIAKKAAKKSVGKPAKSRVVKKAGKKVVIKAKPKKVAKKKAVKKAARKK
jgi:putative FmdB family regulatory protein